ncbi:MAG: enoyl-CoA hydratase-related protein [Myxococcota bacterium]
MPETLEVAVEDHVATVTIVEKAMSPTFFRELDEVFAALESGPDYAAVRAVVVCAREPKAFSYGLDLQKAFGKWGELFRGAGLVSGRSALHKLIKELQQPFERIFRLRVPVIAALHGWCIGGGLDLAAACDIRLGAADLKVSLRETKIAIVADLGSLQRLPHIIGQGRTRELAFTGRDVMADEALAMGLVNAVHPTQGEVIAAAQAMARAIAANAPRTVEGVKQVLNQAIAADVAAGLEHVAAWNSAFLPSEDLGEAVASFVARRPPAFKGR